MSSSRLTGVSDMKTKENMPTHLDIVFLLNNHLNSSDCSLSVKCGLMISLVDHGNLNITDNTKPSLEVVLSIEISQYRKDTMEYNICTFLL